MIRWLAAQHPYALPRVNTADAVVPPGHVDGRAFRDGSAPRRVHDTPRSGDR
jgi:hypothetical protein